MARARRVSLEECFSGVTDPRRRKVVYPLVNIITIAICAVLCGADDFVAIAAYGRAKRQWLSKFLDLSSGIPSHDRFNAVLAAIKPEQFQECPLEFITAIHEITNGQVVAIDGKTLRRSFDRAAGKAAIHMVSAWASANHISLGQVVVDEKSNEITAIPKLLKMLELSGCLVTIDAMGCQVEIAREIVAAGADYVLAVKDNQPTLAKGIDDFFVDHLEDDYARVEARRHTTTDKGSKYLTAKRFAEAVRDHWSIENRLHWQLDVTFQEDQCRIRKGHADANFSSLRRTALSLLKNNHSEKVGIKNKRLLAALNDDYLQEVLLGS